MSDKNLRVKRHLTRRIKLLMRYVCGGERIPAISYFPEQPHKSKARIFGDQCVHILKYGEVDPYYYLYGLDVKGASFKKKGLISYKEFMDWRNLHNRPVHPFNYICILRDKKLFAIVCEHFGIPCVRDLGYIDPGCGSIRLNDESHEDVFSLLEREESIFCKPLDAECGDGIFCLGRNENGYTLNDAPATQEEIVALIGSRTSQHIVQSRLLQHPELNRLYPKSINTIRLVTIRNRRTGAIEYFHSLLRIGANGNVVDNWSQGGVCVGIDENGVLFEEGYYKPPFGLRTTTHPDTGIPFAGFRIPHYREAIEMCKSFHKRIDFIPAIGWDIAITPKGPCLIEANDNWAISLHQVYGGLKERFDHLLK